MTYTSSSSTSLRFALLLFCLLSPLTFAEQVVTSIPPEALPAPADLIVWPEARNPRVASGSAADAGSWLWDGLPAGAHGPLLDTPDGDLVFEDGTPARFWGTTLTYGATFPESDAELKALVDGIAKAGYNLVRFHHNDHVWGSVSFLKNGSAFEHDPERMVLLDKVMKAFIDRGIYIYLDVVDSRGWTEEVGIEDWEQLAKVGDHGWKGTFPMPVMVKAWKRAADGLLTHVNHLTGKSLAEDPAVVCVEILNENGPFWDWGFKTTPSVQKWFDDAWNAWLLERYGDRDALSEAWTDATGTRGLFDDEDPAKGNVYRPQLQKLQEWDRSNRSKARGACRYNDFIAFYRELTTEFYQEAVGHIRGHGFKGRIIGSHELRGPQNQLAEIEGTGSISAHLYAGQRLAFGARPGVDGISLDGVDVRTKNWVVNIPRINVEGVPGWNNEWTATSLSYRADTHLAIASLMAMQGVDGSVHFGWSGRWGGEKMPNKDITVDWIPWRKKFHSSFSSLHDSPSMAIHRVCAAIMRRGDIPAPKYTVHIAHSAEDAAEQNLHAPGLEGGSGTIGGAAHFLPLLHRTKTYFFDKTYDGEADVVFSTGRSASGDYSRARHAVVLGDNPWGDRQHKKRDLTAPARLLHPDLVTRNLEEPVTFRVAFGHREPVEVVFNRLEGAIEIDSLPAGAEAIGVSEDERYTLGWCDDRFLVFPAAGQYDRLGLDPRWLYRFYLTAAERWGLELAPNSIESSVFVSDNGALRTDWGSGSQLLDTPLTQAVFGFAGFRSENRCANLSVTLDRPYGVVALTSADGKPISRSRRMLLVATARIQNTGTTHTVDADGTVRFTKTGQAPKLVEGLHGRIELTSLEAPDRLVVYALDTAGKRLGKVDTRLEDGVLSFELNPRWQTIWFEVADGEIDAPAVQDAEWPGETVALSASPDVDRITVAEMNRLLARKADSEAEAEVTSVEVGADGGRLVLSNPEEFKPYQVYGNIKASVVKESGVPAYDLSLGRHTGDWHAGLWTPVKVPSGLKAADCRGIAFYFKGDGTRPRDFQVTLTWRDAEGETRKTKSRNLSGVFEEDSWEELLLEAKDFPGESVDFSRIQRLDFGVVSNLIENRHTARLGSVHLLLMPGADLTPDTVDVENALPAIRPLAAPELELPLLADAVIDADGDPGDRAWSQAVGIAMDEDAVPDWQHVGSFIADGNRRDGENARFWLLATRKGLAGYAAVDKAGGPIVNRFDDWWRGDCVELFIDAGLTGGKPDKQLFLAYRRPGLDRPMANDPGVQIGRALIPQGYALEFLIPWTVLGVEPVPGTVFGIDFQVDFGGPEGRRLQMVLGTGTNEAWFKSDQYLKIKLIDPSAP